MKTSLLIVMILSFAPGKAQNLARNCDFDLVDQCPTNHSQFDNTSSWFTPGEGTTDLCHECGSSTVGVPNNQWGSQNPRSGKGYGHIICYYPLQGSDYREYMALDLGCALRQGESYTINFFVSCTDRSKYAIDRVGLHFSSQPLNQNGDGVIDIGGEPHIQHPPGSIIQNKDNWVRVSGTYTATGNERYLTIGNFFRDDETNVFEYTSLSTRYGSFYVDQVEVYPQGSWLELGNDTTLCPQQVYTINATIPCALSYTWNDGEIDPVRTIIKPGYYSVEIEIGCGIISDGIEVSFYPEPAVGLPADTFLCEGGSVLLEANSNFNSYEWDNGSRDPERTITDPGIYWLDVVTPGDCAFRDTVSVITLAAPLIALGADTVICSGDSIVLITGIADPLTTITWNEIFAGSSFITGSSGQYTVHAVNPCGEARDTIIIDTRNCTPVLWLPNAFTPNGDGINETFRAKGDNIDDFYMAIYSRWGEKIFETKIIEQGWDGSLHSRPCNDGMYVWVVRYSNASNEFPVNETLTGTVLLIR